MLNRNDYRSIWEIAHLWEELEPPDNDPTELSEGVIDKIHKLIRGFRHEQLNIFHSSGRKAGNISDSLLYLSIMDRTLLRLRKCQKQNHFPRFLLNQFFVQRSELLDFCDKDRTQPPAFWHNCPQKSLNNSEQPEKNLIGKHIKENIDKNRCQAIAMTLWELDPSIHPAHMAKSKAMLEFGNGKDYSGKYDKYETVKGWIKEVDPQGDNRKQGKPADTIYLINLRTHRLEQS